MRSVVSDPQEASSAGQARQQPVAGAQTADPNPGQSLPSRPPAARRLTDGAAVPVLADFCGAGIALRVVLLTNVATLLLALSIGEGPVLLRLLHWLAVLEPILLISILLLCRLRSRINGLPRLRQWVAAVALPVLVASPVCLAAMFKFEQFSGTGQFLGLFLARLTLVAMLTWFLVAFLHLRMVSMTPSLSEARLQALQTRIRPHFLFNSLNTVLGLMRAEPRRAEFILENVADLFRVFMRDTRDLVPIADEIVTCRQYLAIEDLRLGGRLTVQWSLDEMKPDALIPSLLLQPLIENAVHHGIEPVQGPGVITVSVVCSDDEVTVQVGNTMPSPVATRPGNQMGLANVRERLSLLYDTSASFSAGPHEGRFHVTLQFPYRKERRSHVQRTFNPYS